MDRVWEPEFRRFSQEELDEALRNGTLCLDDLESVLALPPSDPKAQSAAMRLLLFRLETKGAPVQ